MSKGAQTFKQADVAKALKAAAKAGFAVQRFEIEAGKIVIFAQIAKPANEWDSIK